MFSSQKKNIFGAKLITISNLMSTITDLLVQYFTMSDLVLGHFDHINQKITLSVST
jgi:hypothetical protein